MPVKLVATMLCSNNESLVSDAIRSVLPWVDQLCFIDTGCTDSSLETAKSMAGSQLTCEKFEWCNDFAAARNAALACAARAGATWALTLDTDERLDLTAYGSAAQLKHALDSDPSAQLWLVPSADGSYYKERFVRIPTQLHWRGKTHESLCGQHPFTRSILPNCSFSEVAKTAEQFQQKLERDLTVLLLEVAQKPNESRWWYYLGQTYEGLKHHRQAVAAYDECIRLDQNPDESSWACYTAARCLVELKEFRLAEEYCARGMTRKPSVAELPWLAGWCCYQRGAWRDAITWSHLAIHLAKHSTPQDYAIFRHVPAWEHAPYEVLYFAHEKLGERATLPLLQQLPGGSTGAASSGREPQAEARV